VPHTGTTWRLRRKAIYYAVHVHPCFFQEAPTISPNTPREKDLPIEPIPRSPDAAPASSAGGGAIAISVGHAANDMYVSLLPPLLPLFAANLGLSHTQAGMLSLLRQLPALLQPVLGHLADRIDLRYLVILAPTITGIMTSFLHLSPNYMVMVLLLTLAGLSTSAFHAIAPTLATNHAQTGSVGRGMALWVFGGEMGFTIGPLLVVTLVQHWSINSMPVLLVLGLAASVYMAVRLRTVPHRDMGISRPLPWYLALSQVRSVMLPLTYLTAARSLAFSALSSYLPMLLSESGAGLWLGGASLTVYQAAGSLGVLLGGSLSDRVGRREIILGSMILSPLFLFAALALNGVGQLLALAAVSLVGFTFTPVALAIVQESSIQNRALATSVYLSLSFLLQALATALVGALGDWIGLASAFRIGAVTLLLGSPLTFLLPKSPSPNRS